MATPTNGARKKLTRLEMTYDDGTRAVLEGFAAQLWADSANTCIAAAHARGVVMPEGLPWQVSAAPNLAMDPATAQRLRKAIGQIDPQEEDRRNAHDQIMRDLARAVGMSPADSPAAIVARVAEEHRELVTLRPAIAAFRACYEGLPSHVHTRPVCAVNGCDNGPRKDGLCAKHYGPFQKGYPVACCPKALDEQKEGR